MLVVGAPLGWAGLVGGIDAVDPVDPSAVGVADRLLPYEVYNTSVKDLFDTILADGPKQDGNEHGRLAYYFEKL